MRFSFVLFRAFVLILLFGIPRYSQAEAQRSLTLSRFGKVDIWSPADAPEKVAILFAGEKEASEDTAAFAEALKNHGAFVAVLSAAEYLKGLPDGECFFGAGEVERLAQVLQSELSLEHVKKALLVGTGEGAGLAAAVYFQHPESFDGLFTVDFCAQLSLPRPPSKSDYLETSPGDENNLLLDIDPDSDTPWLNAFHRPVRSCASAFHLPSDSTYVEVPFKDGHDIATRKTLWNQYDQFFSVEEHEDPASADLSLPVVTLDADDATSDYFVIFYSGDGGWATIDREVGEKLSDAKVNVVGVDALKYFWKPKSPVEASADLVRIMDYFQKRWKTKKVVLVGFSLGADILPGIYDSLPAQAKDRVGALVLLNPGLKVEYEVHLTDWIFESDDGGVPILPLAQQIQKMPVLCMVTIGDEDSICAKVGDPKLKLPNFKVIKMGSTHHFDGQYEKLAEILGQFMKDSVH